MPYSPKPLALTMGDPAGIGPEIIAMCLEKPPGAVGTIVFGCPNVMRRAVEITGGTRTVRALQRLEDARPDPGVIEVLETTCFDAPPAFGGIAAENGQAAFTALVRAIEQALAGRVAGIVTAPLHKEALSAAGLEYPGHTEILAKFAKVEKVAMLLGNDAIRTVLVTAHCSLSQAITRADFNAQLSAIRFAHLGATDLGFENPRVAVAGLNPHAGEGGLFGREEIEIIAPAIATARKEGIDVSGPWPGDTVFMQARQGRFDIVVAQYHDQGLIPVKYMGLERGVNVTLGLPFVRTSPDHGTAFDISGKGIADPASLETAVNTANRLVASKSREAS